jgi:glycosyltransferase involved in cell wall biosynthesis
MLFHGVYILSKDPYILAFWGDDAWRAVTTLKRKPDVILWHCAWHQGTVARMLKLKYKFHQMKKLGIQPILVVNSNEEERYRKRLKINGFKSSAYVFVDENEYLPHNSSKRYDAVYAAQLTNFKRIPLAQRIEKLYVMTYKSGSSEWDLRREYPEMKNADFNQRWLNPNEKNQLLNQSSVGLCLSAEEGPMLASLEYMLNGLPVVSTPSKGGRDEYYSSEYCRVVPPEPEAVRQGVDELIQSKVDPLKIRESTIEKLQADRQVYVNYVSKLLQDKFGCSKKTQQLAEQWFTSPKNNFITLKDLDEVDE